MLEYLNELNKMVAFDGKLEWQAFIVANIFDLKLGGKQTSG